jgi:hypothetical protein
MFTEAELAEYLEEIRKQVCEHCIERPPGGPPCLPLGKECGVEMHLPAVIEAIRKVHSPLLGPYQRQSRESVCTHCRLLGSAVCPCPMDYLAGLLVQAVETVDERRAARV